MLQVTLGGIMLCVACYIVEKKVSASIGLLIISPGLLYSKEKNKFFLISDFNIIVDFFDSS